MENPYSGPERRLYKRISIRLPVIISLIGVEESEENAKFQEGLTIDMSGGGMALKVKELREEFLPKLQSGVISLGLKFEIPNDSTPIKAFAKAIWVRKRDEPDKEKPYYLLGVQFIDIAERDRDKIISFIVSGYMDR